MTPLIVRCSYLSENAQATHTTNEERRAMPRYESPLRVDHLPEALRIHLFNALERHGWIDAVRKSAGGLRSAGLWLGLAAFTARVAATVMESVADDSAPVPPV